MPIRHADGRTNQNPVSFPRFAGLVAIAGSLYPIPSRTRPLNSPAPMILSLKAWKSRSLPGLPKTEILLDAMIKYEKALAETRGLLSFYQHCCCRPREGGDPVITAQFRNPV